MGSFLRRNARTVAVAVIAAVIASVATAGAARLITGKQIKDGTITGADLSKAVRAQLARAGDTGAKGDPGPKGDTGAKGDPGTPGRFADLQLPDGTSNATVFAFPGLGTLRASCASGVTVMNFLNTAAGPIDVREWGVINDSPDAPVMNSTAPDVGAAPQQSSAPQGLMGISYLVSYTSGSTSRVADIQVSTKNLLGSTCALSASATSTG